MDSNCFTVTIEGGVAQVVLSRGDQLNTMTWDFWRELPEIIQEIDATSSARVILLSSTGRHFCAGMDLANFTTPKGGAKPEAGRSSEVIRREVLKLQASLSCLEKCRMPTIAAIQGGCIGGGVDLVSACDIRYCTEDAFFSIQEINLGITADVGTLQRLPHLLPSGLVRELAYTGRRMPATEAREAGLVNRVFADAEAMHDGVIAIAREIAGKSPLAMHGTKEMLNYTRDHGVADALDYMALWQSGMLRGADMAEIFAARAEKREPKFDELEPHRGIGENLATKLS